MERNALWLCTNEGKEFSYSALLAYSGKEFLQNSDIELKEHLNYCKNSLKNTKLSEMEKQRFHKQILSCEGLIFLRGENWSLFDRIQDENSLDIAVFTRGKEVMISFGGTVDREDAYDDIFIPFKSIEIKQFESAVAKVIDIINRMKNDLTFPHSTLSIKITGHSLGGGIGEYVTVCLVDKNIDVDHCAVFNAAGIKHRLNFQQLMRDYKGRYPITSVVTSHDILNILAPAVANRFIKYDNMLDHPGKLLLLEGRTPSSMSMLYKLIFGHKDWGCIIPYDNYIPIEAPNPFSFYVTFYVSQMLTFLVLLLLLLLYIPAGYIFQWVFAVALILLVIIGIVINKSNINSDLKHLVPKETFKYAKTL